MQLPRILRAGIFFFVLSLLAIAPAAAQRITAEGTVRTQDGKPVVGAKVEVISSDSGATVGSGKSKKNGTFRFMFFPRVEAGKYKLKALRDGMLMSGIDVRLLAADRSVGAEFDLAIGPIQELHEFVLTQNGGVQVDFTMVPEDHFGGYLAIVGNAGATKTLGRANKLSASEEFAGSNELLRELLADGILHPSIYYLLGRNALAQGSRDEGLTWFEKALELDPTLVGVHEHLASAAAERGEHQKAFDLYIKELAISPESPTARLGHAVMLRELGRVDDAERELLALTETDSNGIWPYAQLAILYIEQEQEEKSVAILERMEAAGGGEPTLWYNVGANFSNHGQFDHAVAAYKKALALNPDFAEAIVAVAYLLIRQDDLTAADEHFARYLELRPDAPDAAEVKAIRQALAKSMK